MRWVLVAGLVVTGAARAEERPLFGWERPTLWETAPLVPAVALIWVDVLQSIDAQRQHRVEGNPLLGRHPGDLRLAMIGGVLPTLLLMGVWYLLPCAWRVLAPSAVLGAEVFNVWDNAHSGLSIRF